MRQTGKTDVTPQRTKPRPTPKTVENTLLLLIPDVPAASKPPFCNASHHKGWHGIGFWMILVPSSPLSSTQTNGSKAGTRLGHGQRQNPKSFAATLSEAQQQSNRAAATRPFPTHPTHSFVVANSAPRSPFHFVRFSPLPWALLACLFVFGRLAPNGWLAAVSAAAAWVKSKRSSS